jgi:hypothetical protein
MTNREFYLFVRNLKETYENAPNRSLEAYLSALWKLVTADPPETPTLEQFVHWLEAAFHAEAPPFDPRWLDIEIDYGQNFITYDDCINLLLFQIADLHRMKEAGVFENEYRYFGVQSPTGESWYNFDPLTYLECGIRGNYRGYKAEEVIITIPPPEGQSADSEIYEIDSFSWQNIADTLVLGQLYE